MNRPHTVNSTRYDTVATSGTQDRARYDVVNADVDVDLLELEQGTKEVTKKDFTVEHDEVTRTRDNFITINKLCDVEYEEEVQETILVDVDAVCQQTVNQPLAETVFVDKVAVRAEKVGYVGGAHAHGLGAHGFGGALHGGVAAGHLVGGGLVGGYVGGSITSSPFHTSSGDGVSGSDCGSWCSSDSDDGHFVVGRAGYGLAGAYGAGYGFGASGFGGAASLVGGAGLGFGGLAGGAHAHVAPVVAKRAYAVTVPKTVLVDNFVTIDVACVKQEEQVVTKTVTKTRKEPCTETVNYQTTVTQDIPRTNVFEVTDSVDVTRQGSRTDTIERDVAVRRVEDAPTTSMQAVRTDSSYVRDNLTATQSLGTTTFDDLTFVPHDVEVERQNLRYEDVEKVVSYDASIEGTEVRIQEVPRQERILRLQTDLGPIGEDIFVPSRGSNGNILVGADATFVAAGGLSRPIVASNGIVGDNVIVGGAPATTLNGDVILDGGLGRDGVVFVASGAGGSNVGVGAGTVIADGSIVQNGDRTIGAVVDGATAGVRVGGFGGARFGGAFGGLARGGFRTGGFRTGGNYSSGYNHGW